MKEQNTDTKLILRNVRLSFPELFVPVAYEEGKPKKYEATFLIPKNSPQMAEVQAAIIKAARAKWGPDAEKVLKQLQASNRTCITDGDLKDYAGYAGNWALKAKNEVRPPVRDRQGGAVVSDSGAVYSGCYVNGHISFWAQDHPQWGKRINANLRGIQFVADGEAFTGGGVATDDEFESVAADETVGGGFAMDDDLPF